VRAAELAARYSRELRRQLGLWPAWLPDARLRVGDFGRVQGGVFVPEGRVGQLGVRVGKPARHTVADQLFASRGVRQAMLAGEAAEQQVGARAGARIEFGRGFGVVVALRECHEQRVADLVALAAQLDRSRAAGAWSDDRCLVLGVVKARAALIAVSADGGGALELAAGAPAGDLLGLLGTELRVAREASVGYRCVLASGCTPLVRLFRLTRRGELTLRGPAAAPPTLVEVDARAGLDQAPSSS